MSGNDILDKRCIPDHCLSSQSSKLFLEILYPGERILRMNGAWPILVGNGRFRGVFVELVLRDYAQDKALKGVHDS